MPSTSIIAKNSDTLPDALDDTVLQLGGGTAMPARLAIDSFGGNGVVTFRRANGSNTSKTPLLADDLIAMVNASGYQDTDYTATSRVQLGFFAAENWSDAASGTYMSFVTTTNGTETPVQRWHVQNDGNFVPVGAATYDVGVEGGEVRDIHAQRNVLAASTGGAAISSPADGALQLLDSAGTDFDRLVFGPTSGSHGASIKLQSYDMLSASTADGAGYYRFQALQFVLQDGTTFLDDGGGNLTIQPTFDPGDVIVKLGGSTDEYPALKRSDAELHVRLADDSADASVHCADVVSSGNVSAEAIRSIVCLVSQLPSTGNTIGDRRMVSDTSSVWFAQPPAGGGTAVAPVYWNGSAWLVG